MNGEHEGTGNGAAGEPVEVMQDGSKQLAQFDNRPALGEDINQLVKTAKMYPRSVKKSTDRAITLATMDEQTAGECFYIYERGKKTIEGPSVRVAEIIASTWENLRYGSRIVGHDDKEVTTQGFCHDLESNVFVAVETKRRITDRQGRTYNDDMITVTGNASAAISRRNAVFSVIPRVLARRVYLAAKKVATGDAKTLPQRRQTALEQFEQINIGEEAILRKVGKETIEDVDLNDLLLLRGVFNAIRDRETTIDEEFPVVVQAAPGDEDGATTLLGGKGKGKKDEPTVPPPPEEEQGLL